MDDDCQQTRDEEQQQCRQRRRIMFLEQCRLRRRMILAVRMMAAMGKETVGSRPPSPSFCPRASPRPPSSPPVRIFAALKVSVRNPDLFALDYSRLDIDVAYCGKALGRVSARAAVSYIDADLDLNGICVVEDAIYLLEDLARRSIPFDTVVQVEGNIHFFFFTVLVKVRVAGRNPNCRLIDYVVDYIYPN
ncbi:hypothetical protein ACQ4PT_065862 [Festuca glaucescens]